MFARSLGYRFKMKDSLYQGDLVHTRFFPVAHSFKYNHVCLYADIENIAKIADVNPFVSIEKWNLLSFYRQDFLPSERSLYDEVRSVIQKKTGVSFSGRVFLLANWRSFGIAMNPLSLFYCFENEVLRYVVGEVHNTPWNERHVYVLDITEVPVTSDKSFHVSPFMPMEIQYEWALDTPDDKLYLGIKLEQQGEKLFSAAMKMKGQPITKNSLNSMIRRFPFMTLRTIILIYFQAIRLWLKRVPFVKHPSKIEG